MVYQLILVLKSTLKEAEQKKLLENIKSLLGKAKITEKTWGQKALAYPIKREVSGLFLNWRIDSENIIPNGFEKKLLGNDNILRHLLLRK
ncbi:MAG: 30S ribosomal protein S6 [Candidatus Levybacteria bacterium]|nr:30S ribosomal protein S6 [Candidatus Levybacteria bacterium]